MKTHSPVEHICLASEHQDEQERPRVTNVRFDQRSRWRRTEARFTIFNEHHVAIERRGLGGQPLSYQLDLSFLASRPRRIREISWALVALALALFGVAAATRLFTLPGGSGALGAALLLAGAMALAVAAFRYRDCVIYFSKHGRAPLLVLLNGNPDRAALQQFIADISGRIRATRRNWPDRHAYLSAELKEHRRLHEQGVISQTDYERIKRRILRQHDPSGG